MILFQPFYNASIHNDYRFRIGLVSVATSTKVYLWIDGSKVDYTNWQPGDPDGLYERNVAWYSPKPQTVYKQWVNDGDYNRFSVCSFVL